MAGETVLEAKGLARRAALLAPLALTGCGLWDKWFGETQKPPIPGMREPVLPPGRPLVVDPSAPKVVLPRPIRNAGWPQAGGNPAHDMGHLAANPDLAPAWTVNIGAGGGYRRKILAQPVVANGLVYTMDSNGTVTAFTLSDGSRVWRTETKGKHVRSSNVGGGLGAAGGTLYAVNGLGDVVALDAAKGSEHWRIDTGVPARSAPTIVEDRLFFTTIQDRLLALAATDGHTIWTFQGDATSPSLLGLPAPAFANGLVIAGFSSGELACLRAENGAVVWSDSLGGYASGGVTADFSAIRGRPAISAGHVIAIGMGGLMLCLDLPTGRRLWERQVSGEDSPWVAGEWVFIITVAQELAALTIANGQVAWISPLPRWRNPVKGSGPISWWGPTMMGNRLVVASTEKQALSVSPYTGSILGREKLPSPAAPLEPVVADGTLLLISDDGKLLALR
ncbi:MAG TPA: PQQ-binding-like beta-propeller repeat protein [Acetobacteraceae bacterium]|nr:PQQ-binding-like beta-propeller repeat protein [Acetobacteraceae bacterium]